MNTITKLKNENFITETIIWVFVFFVWLTIWALFYKIYLDLNYWQRTHYLKEYCNDFWWQYLSMNDEFYIDNKYYDSKPDIEKHIFEKSLKK